MDLIFKGVLGISTLKQPCNFRFVSPQWLGKHLNLIPEIHGISPKKKNVNCISLLVLSPERFKFHTYFMWILWRWQYAFNVPSIFLCHSNKSNNNNEMEINFTLIKFKILKVIKLSFLRVTRSLTACLSVCQSAT